MKDPKFKEFVAMIAPNVYFVKLIEGDIWLFMWSDNLKNWISDRRLEGWESMMLRHIEIPEKQANFYHGIAKKTQETMVFNPLKDKAGLKK